MESQVVSYISITVLVISSSAYAAPCLQNCRGVPYTNSLCETTRCRSGCETGWHGSLCTRRCSPLCLESVCDQLDGRCTIGCQQSWLKKSHSRLCPESSGIFRRSLGSCLRKNNDSTCGCCEQGFRGEECEKLCPNCLTIQNNNDCGYLCESGFYGDTCELACPDSCKEGVRGKPVCTQNDDREAECYHCPAGRYGQLCQNTCSTKCLDNKCNIYTGVCVACDSGYYGLQCDRNCSTMCNDGGCHMNGACINGCQQGYQDPMCNYKIVCLSNCSDCDKTKDNVSCRRECRDTCSVEVCHLNGSCRYRCSDKVCEEYCKTKGCTAVLPGKDDVKPSGGSQTDEGATNVAIVVPILIILVIIGGVCVFIYCKRRKRAQSAQRRNKNERASVDEKRKLMSSENTSHIRIIVITSLQEEEEEAVIDQMLEQPHSVEIRSTSLKEGRIGNETVLSIPIKKVESKSQNLLTRVIGMYKNVKHVFICGVYKEIKKDSSMPRVDVLLSDFNEPSETEGSSLIEIVPNLVKSGPTNPPWRINIERCQAKLKEGSNASTEKEVSLDILTDTGCRGDKKIQAILESVKGGGVESYIVIRGTSQSEKHAHRNAAAVTVTIIEHLNVEEGHLARETTIQNSAPDASETADDKTDKATNDTLEDGSTAGLSGTVTEKLESHKVIADELTGPKTSELEKESSENEDEQMEPEKDCIENEDELKKTEKDRIDNEDELKKTEKDRIDNEDKLKKTEDRIVNEDELKKTEKVSIENEDELKKAEKDRIDNEDELKKTEDRIENEDELKKTEKDRIENEDELKKTEKKVEFKEPQDDTDEMMSKTPNASMTNEYLDNKPNLTNVKDMVKEQDTVDV